MTYERVEARTGSRRQKNAAAAMANSALSRLLVASIISEAKGKRGVTLPEIEEGIRQVVHRAYERGKPFIFAFDYDEDLPRALERLSGSFVVRRQGRRGERFFVTSRGRAILESEENQWRLKKLTGLDDLGFLNEE